MRAIFVDLANELQELADEVDMLKRSVAEHEATKSTLTEQMAWLHTAGLASGIEKVYTRCERIMATIAVQIDQSAVSRDHGWHATLLRRMHNAFPGGRDALIADDTYHALNDLRAFRHRERNSYGLALDPKIVEQRASEAIVAFELFKRDFLAFSKTVLGEADPGSQQTP